MSGQLQEDRAGGREFQISGDATKSLRAPNAVRANGVLSGLVLKDLREQAESESAGGNGNTVCSLRF